MGGPLPFASAAGTCCRVTSTAVVIALSHARIMYPVQVVVIAVVGLFFSALLLALVLWLMS